MHILAADLAGWSYLMNVFYKAMNIDMGVGYVLSDDGIHCSLLGRIWPKWLYLDIEELRVSMANSE